MNGSVCMLIRVPSSCVCKLVSNLQLVTHTEAFILIQQIRLRVTYGHTDEFIALVLDSKEQFD